MDILREIENFYSYCLDFYEEKKGIYPIANKKIIYNAIGEYLTKARLYPVEFDSIDREAVREIIETRIKTK